MGKTFTNLAYMGGAYLVCIVSVVLNFIVFQPGGIFNNDLHDLVCKTFIVTQRRVGFNHLYLGLFIYDHQTARLGKNVYRTGIRNMINIKRMFNLLSLCYVDENSSVYKSRIECVDSILQ